jgi:hypothetical protein
MTTPTNLDPVSIAGAIAGAFIGPQLAPYIGAYSVIVLAWIGGVIIGLYRRDPTSRMSAAGFVTVTFVVTLCLTATAATILSRHLPADSTTLLAPVAIMIPAIGDSWIDIVKWGVNRLRARWEKE